MYIEALPEDDKDDKDAWERIDTEVQIMFLVWRKKFNRSSMDASLNHLLNLLNSSL